MANKIIQTIERFRPVIKSAQYYNTLLDEIGEMQEIEYPDLFVKDLMILIDFRKFIPMETRAFAEYCVNACDTYHYIATNLDLRILAFHKYVEAAWNHLKYLSAITPDTPMFFGLFMDIFLTNVKWEWVAADIPMICDKADSYLIAVMSVIPRPHVYEGQPIPEGVIPRNFGIN